MLWCRPIVIKTVVPPQIVTVRHQHCPKAGEWQDQSCNSVGTTRATHLRSGSQNIPRAQGSPTVSVCQMALPTIRAGISNQPHGRR